MKLIYFKQDKLKNPSSSQNFKIFRAKSFTSDYQGVGIVILRHEFSILWKEDSK